MKTTHLNRALLALTISLALWGSGCLGLGKKKATPDTTASAEPDKVLYDRALDDFKHSRFTIARLSFQTLINTYPDSEYLAKAKLAIADSYYKEGGTEGLSQAVAEYKDFITFFPFLDEAPYAQIQVAMAHYRLMEKPDRDRTEARAAEDELQTFLLKYPQSPLVPQAEQHLREVQETLAEGDYRVAHYYYVKESYRAAAARLLSLTNRYPLYSQSDHALWMLGDIYNRAEKRDIAERYYARIVRDYPESSLVAGAKKKLVAAGVPVPQPDPGALARMQEEQKFAHERAGMLRRSLALLRSGPDVSRTAHSGVPTLTPEGEGVSATEVLRPGGGSPGSISGSPGGGGTAGNAVAIETVPSDSSTTAPATSGTLETATSGSTETAPIQAPDANAPPAPTGPVPKIGGTSTYTDAVAAGKISAETTAAPPSDATQGSIQSATAPAAQKADQPQQAPKADPKTESTSKKKKGLRKLIPW
jgi:outer membrane protein assembly factor BamD